MTVTNETRAGQTDGAGVGEFRAACRYRPEHPDDQLTFSDPGDFSQHMTKVHGARAVQTAWKPIKAWKPPRQRRNITPYAPAGTEVGAWITYSDGTRERRGQIWSQGPSNVGRSLWIVDEQTRRPVLVRPNRQLTKCFSAVRTADPALTVRRIENLRRFGHLFPVVEEVRDGWSFTSGRTKTELWRWHADPHCPDAQGKDRPEKGYRQPAYEVINRLLDGSINNSEIRACLRCFWLNTSEPTS